MLQEILQVRSGKEHYVVRYEKTCMKIISTRVEISYVTSRGASNLMRTKRTSGEKLGDSIT